MQIIFHMKATMAVAKGFKLSLPGGSVAQSMISRLILNDNTPKEKQKLLPTGHQIERETSSMGVILCTMFGYC